jgi:hypothetical protein
VHHTIVILLVGISERNLNVNAHEKIATAERNATCCIPRFAFQKIAGIINEQVFDAWIKNDRPKRSLGAGSNVPPVVGAVENH